ncbi:polynucleotide kinase-phosphatase [Exiguobacterium sp. SH5S4]|uniref:polynucleotide kinase-phosphatase n=1 Tax=Exiguobacterium sp. SH5S4 TaxID=2510961 RepID=UPI00103B3C35|nr:polynucleotide kinase-phosphatase [Exiguobacterium sp. SH5S4]TCI27732.1 polynucleotide kinase-phosphatase [Exiguobacterium sp. SH5S4]
MQIQLPYAGIVLLVGPSNSGKSTWLKRLIENKTIRPSEVVSSDDYRNLVGDVEHIDWKGHPSDEADALYEAYQNISTEAFALMTSLIEARARLNKLTIIDATHLYASDRKKYIELARRLHQPVYALVLDIDQVTLLERDQQRDFPRGGRRVKQQVQVFNREKRSMKREGFDQLHIVADVEKVELVRPMNNPLHISADHGIDVIGDIHGCFDEFIELLGRLGYSENEEGLYVHPEGRTFLSLGDIMSRGPKSLETIRFFVRHVEAGLANMIDSNHGWKVLRWLEGRNVTMKHGDELFVEELNVFEEENGAELTEALRSSIKRLLKNAPSHYVLTKHDIPTAVCVHAGIRDEFIGKSSRDISDFCRYGDNDGFDDSGKPIRKDWTVQHHSKMLIIWGHDPRQRPLRLNQTINIDQGVVFGGNLTAFRYPEQTFVQVEANQDYAQVDDNPLVTLETKRLDPPNIGKFMNGYTVETEAFGTIHVSKETIEPSIDLVSHHTVPLEELVYVPPTMSPTPKPAAEAGYLEHPDEAIAYYREHGITRLIAEKKHMGSRAILLVFKDEDAAERTIGRRTKGIIYTRSGRRFFESEQELEVVTRLHQSLISHEYFTTHQTEFVLLDAEILPWNLKARDLIRNQYAHVAEQALLDREQLKHALESAVDRVEGVRDWYTEVNQKLEQAETFKQAFQTYCWDVEDINAIKIAPFHVLAHSEETFFDKTHEWHMGMNQRFADMDELFLATEYRLIEDPDTANDVIEWWKAMTEEGHEGIVIKPDRFLTQVDGKLIQPAIKVRGRKYLSIIYGMDYLEPENLKRLKKRNVSKKQKLALREFALGMEGIKRFVHREPLERYHECVLATLAMEAEPVDPRL